MARVNSFSSEEGGIAEWGSLWFRECIDLYNDEYRARVVGKHDTMEDRLKGFPIGKIVLWFRGCPRAHLTSQEGDLGPKLCSFRAQLWFACSIVRFSSILTHGGGFE